jgi:hypothetical protein
MKSKQRLKEQVTRPKRGEGNEKSEKPGRCLFNLDASGTIAAVAKRIERLPLGIERLNIYPATRKNGQDHTRDGVSYRFDQEIKNSGGRYNSHYKQETDDDCRPCQDENEQEASS